MKRLPLFLSLGLAALALIVAVPVAFSRGPGPGDGDGPRGDRHAFMIKQLGLDAKQTAALQALRSDHRDDVDSIHEQIRAKREAIKTLWLAPNPEKNQILAAEREINALHGQLAESRVDFIFAAKGVLTPAQFSKFIELRGERGFGKHGRGRHQRGEGRGECDGGGPHGPAADPGDRDE